MTTAAAPRQLHLGAFLFGVGHHIAAWRHPNVDPAAALRPAHYKQLARIAESGLFDAIFSADTMGLPGTPAEALSRNVPPHQFEPLELLTALAGVTERIGLVGTVSTTYLPPYHLARKVATLDHLSAGRAGWNLVTSGSDPEAQLFGLDQQISHADRYERAREYVDVVKGLWDTFEDQPNLFDKAAGRYFDPAKLHRLAHDGKYFKVHGALQSQRPVQGYPVLVQAGSSEDGQELAAATAELVFTAHQSVESARTFYASLKGRLAAHGRSPDALKILPGVSPVVGRTEAEAQEKYEQLQALIEPSVGLGLLSHFVGGFDFSPYPLDGPVPDLPPTEGWQSRQDLFLKLAREENLTLRQLYQRVATARGHWTVVGTPESVADQLEHWFTTGAADGFNIMAPTLPFDLQDFVDLVIPELQRRGLFRTAYTGHTLREHLGLPRPAHPAQR
ncbi:LLM class flavin-dependent oxidoreductase [Giesbergeria anulus]|uniref:FMN-dependent oxidoreductase, nitrilotriacetate monooxygenase family n=1 Tax=Giesbergeria anulus TaxID=180197 RepID=A0A1H9KMN6_9BURK|nr:LLM class flavin-dependent oxidoreductase [Giesbergeria anulus]SER00352.1 FMN-dependent oxidoreductase, nitrilotriacetate monooxygenase family [Giesbergeria anulus]